MERLSLSKLKGIKVYVENDLYELALLNLKLIDAKAKHDGSNTRTRPTVKGLGNKFAQFIDSLNPDYNKVFSVIEEHKLPLGAAIDFDDSC